MCRERRCEGFTTAPKHQIRLKFVPKYLKYIYAPESLSSANPRQYSRYYRSGHNPHMARSALCSSSESQGATEQQQKQRALPRTHSRQALPPAREGAGRAPARAQPCPYPCPGARRAPRHGRPQPCTRAWPGRPGRALCRCPGPPGAHLCRRGSWGSSSPGSSCPAPATAAGGGAGPCPPAAAAPARSRARARSPAAAAGAAAAGGGAAGGCPAPRHGHAWGCPARRRRRRSPLLPLGPWRGRRARRCRGAPRVGAPRPGRHRSSWGCHVVAAAAAWAGRAPWPAWAGGGCSLPLLRRPPPPRRLPPPGRWRGSGSRRAARAGGTLSVGSRDSRKRGPRRGREGRVRGAGRSSRGPVPQVAVAAAAAAAAPSRFPSQSRSLRAAAPAASVRLINNSAPAARPAHRALPLGAAPLGSRSYCAPIGCRARAWVAEPARGARGGAGRGQRLKSRTRAVARPRAAPGTCGGSPGGNGAGRAPAPPSGLPLRAPRQRRPPPPRAALPAATARPPLRPVLRDHYPYSTIIPSPKCSPGGDGAPPRFIQSLCHQLGVTDDGTRDVGNIQADLTPFSLNCCVYSPPVGQISCIFIVIF